MRAAAVAALLGTLAALLAACAQRAPAPPSETAPPSRPATPPPPPLPTAKPGNEVFAWEGELTQGGWIRGIAPQGATSATLDGVALVLDDSGHFFAAFDRDAGPSAVLVAQLPGGRSVTKALAIAPRAWQIERVDVARLPGGPTEAFMKIRRPELDRIVAARAVDHPVAGWRQGFVWPARGRLSGRFGSQRVYRGGEAGSYHSGLDIATGGEGAVYVAPADGVVTLAATTPFSLEGNLLIVDHGGGLNSAFLHSRRLYVKAGERVVQGQKLGEIGMTGRATGPHLHWGVMWRGRRLDPLLLTGPMPTS